MRVYRVVTRQVTLSVLASEIGITTKILSRFEQGGNVMQFDWMQILNWLLGSDQDEKTRAVQHFAAEDQTRKNPDAPHPPVGTE